MYFVGATEIVAGSSSCSSRATAPVVAAWLAGIVINLLTHSGYYDIACATSG